MDQRPQRFVLGLLGGVALLASPAVAEDATGHWFGKLKAPGDIELTIVAHIRPGPDGALQGYAESPDQAPVQIPMAEIKATPDTLAFATPSVGATFQGKWDASAQGWVGALIQNGQTLPLTLVRGAPPPRAVVQGLDGDWSGVLETGQGDLRLKLHVKTDADGTTALFQSPDQSPMQIVAVVTHVGDAVTFELKGIGGFAGKLSADGGLAEGSWRQGGFSLPLTLKRER